MDGGRLAGRQASRGSARKPSGSCNGPRLAISWRGGAAPKSFRPLASAIRSSLSGRLAMRPFVRPFFPNAFGRPFSCNEGIAPINLWNSSHQIDFVFMNYTPMTFIDPIDSAVSRVFVHRALRKSTVHLSIASPASIPRVSINAIGVANLFFHRVTRRPIKRCIGACVRACISSLDASSIKRRRRSNVVHSLPCVNIVTEFSFKRQVAPDTAERRQTSRNLQDEVRLLRNEPKLERKAFSSRI